MKNNSTSSKKRIILWTLLGFVTVLLIFSISSYIYIQSKLNLINRNSDVAVVNPEDEFFEEDTIDGEIEGEVLNPEDIEWPEDDGSDDITKPDENIINILLIGQDRRPGEGRARSDSMMIASMNKKNGSIKLISLMRDMYLQIPGYSDNRINTAYLFGGMKLLNEVIEKNFHVHIDGNIEVDFEGFIKGIDIIGGVDISITSKEATHLRNRGFSNLKAGMVHMDGKLALAYSRIRKIGDDFGRTQRQRNVILAAVRKIKDSSISDVMALANKVLPLVTTDMTNAQLLDLAYKALSMNLDNIEQYRIPVDGSYRDAWIRGMLVLVPDLEINRQELKKIIYDQTETFPTP
jgi:LCP family protein required for cell wall assembly